MRKITSTLLVLFIGATSYSQNVGIGTITPTARLHVSDSSVLFTGPTEVPLSTLFGPPASGAGTRLFWYPQKGAFRTGSVLGTFWDKDSIGLMSFGSGYNSRATGYVSTSMGYATNANGYASVSLGNSTTASGASSTSMGYRTIASGLISTSFGEETTASGRNSTSMGYFTKAYGEASTSLGFGTNALGFFSTSMGMVTTASGIYSTSMGTQTFAIGTASTSLGAITIARADNSTTMGANTIARSNNSLVIGQFNDTAAVGSLFEIGNGSANELRNNAITVLNNGNIGLGTISPNATLQFGNTVSNRKLVLYEASNNDHQFSGFGLNNDAVRFQVASTGGDFAYYAGTSSTSSVEVMRIKGNGFVGIGTNTPGQALHVVGNIFATGTITPSDARFKRNITLIHNPLEKLKQLNGVTYNYRSDEFPEMKFPDITQVGLIAQDVEKVFPQLVYTDAKGYKAVDYVKLIPLLIETAKVQEKQQEDFQKTIKKQQEEIDALKVMVEKLIERN